MQVVARTLEPARCTADLRRKVENGLVGIAGTARGFALAPLRIFVNSTAIRTARHITHAAAKLHSVGRNDSVVIGRHIAEHDFVFGILGEGKRAEVNPRAAAHLLIHAEGGLAAFVIDSI